MTLDIESLFLDAQNPRHEPLTAQNEIIRAIIDEQGAKLANLAADIAVHGLSPLDRVLVYKARNRYVVLEGNRRVAAIKSRIVIVSGKPLSRQIAISNWTAIFRVVGRRRARPT